MRKIVITVLVLLSIMVSNCGSSTNRNAGSSESKAIETGSAKLIFKEYEHNFGNVTEGEKVGFIFSFENKGTNNLVITSATTSCGCTVPKYDTKPIPPGGNGNLEVVFDTSGRNGMQTKTITVNSNASIPVVLLRITAEVVPTLI
jgi:hypothetical protein